jgi:hypothetical protein
MKTLIVIIFTSLTTTFFLSLNYNNSPIFNSLYSLTGPMAKYVQHQTTILFSMGVEKTKDVGGKLIQNSNPPTTLNKSSTENPSETDREELNQLINDF